MLWLFFFLGILFQYIFFVSSYLIFRNRIIMMISIISFHDVYSSSHHSIQIMIHAIKYLQSITRVNALKTNPKHPHDIFSESSHNFLHSEISTCCRIHSNSMQPRLTSITAHDIPWKILPMKPTLCTPSDVIGWWIRCKSVNDGNMNQCYIPPGGMWGIPTKQTPLICRTHV